MSESNSQTVLTPQYADDCVLREGIQFEDLIETGRGEVVRVHPCASEKGKIMAEISLPTRKNNLFLDPKILCRLLEAYGRRFAEMKCSSKLGVGRVMWKARRTYVYKHGKFDVRFALSQDDALKTMNSIGRLILGSIYCERCGRPALECALGQCGKCLSGSPELVSLDEHLNAPLLMRGVDAIAEAINITRDILEELSGSRSVPVSHVSKFESKIQEGVEFSLDFSVKTPEQADASIAVGPISLAFGVKDFFERIIELTEFLTEKKAGEEEMQIVGRLGGTGLEAFEALLGTLRSNDLNRLKIVEQKDSELHELCGELEQEIKDDGWENASDMVGKMCENASLVWSGLLQSHSL